jgi:hypothetical protein
VTAPVYLDRPTGTDRSDDPLMNLDPVTEPFKTALMRGQWYLTYVTGYAQAPIARQWSERMYHPRPGDLVYVIDRILGGPRDQGADTRVKSFGYYLCARHEPMYDPEAWAEVADQYEGKPCPTEKVFYLQYGPNPDDVCRWENAECRVIATEETTREARGR